VLFNAPLCYTYRKCDMINSIMCVNLNNDVPQPIKTGSFFSSYRFNCMAAARQATRNALTEKL
jgi:hypothetical protein